MSRILIIVFINVMFSTGLFTQNSIRDKKDQNFKIIKSFYTKDSPDEISFYRILQDFGSLYYTKGKAAFDADGNVIQKIIKNKKISQNNLEKYIAKASKGRSLEIIKDSPKVIFIQLETRYNPEIFAKRKEISKKIDDRLKVDNLGSSYGIDIGNNVVNMEFEINDWNDAFSIILNILQKEKVLQHCIIGKRVYIEADDYLYEIVYPIDYEGEFYPF